MTSEHDMIIDLSQSSPPPQQSHDVVLSMQKPEEWDTRIKAALAVLPPSDDTRMRTKFIEGLIFEYVSTKTLIHWPCTDLNLSLMLHILPAPQR